MGPQKEFVTTVFLSASNDFKPIEWAIRCSNVAIVKYLFDKQEIKDQYKSNDPLMYRLLVNSFAYNSNAHITDYVLSALNISKKKVIEMLIYQCPQSESADFWDISILTAILWTGTFEHLQRFIDYVGEQVFIDHAFNVDGMGRDVMRWAIRKKKLNVVEYLLTIDQIKQKYLKDINALHYLCESFNQWIEHKECIKYAVDSLSLTEAKLTELNAFRAIDIVKIIPFTK